MCRFGNWYRSVPEAGCHRIPLLFCFASIITPPIHDHCPCYIHFTLIEHGAAGTAIVYFVWILLWWTLVSNHYFAHNFYRKEYNITSQQKYFYSRVMYFYYDHYLFSLKVFLLRPLGQCCSSRSHQATWHYSYLNHNYPSYQRYFLKPHLFNWY